jgi:hypothetical protein
MTDSVAIFLSTLDLNIQELILMEGWQEYDADFAM